MLLVLFPFTYAHVLRTLPKNLHLISMLNVLRLTTYMCILPCFWKSKLPMIDKWPPILNQLDIRDQVATYPSPPATEPQHRHTLFIITFLHRVYLPSPRRWHVISIHHCDSESFLSLSDSPLTSSSHSDGHPVPKCVVCHLSNRGKSGLSCTKCHNYFHLSCSMRRKPLNIARMLPYWRCSDCIFGTVTSPGEPSITGSTSSEPVFAPLVF